MAVVGDEVVGGLLLADAGDDGLGCVPSEYDGIFSSWFGGVCELTSSPCRVIIEARLTDLECLPLLPLYFLIRVDDMEILVLLAHTSVNIPCVIY